MVCSDGWSSVVSALGTRRSIIVLECLHRKSHVSEWLRILRPDPPIHPRPLSSTEEQVRGFRVGAGTNRVDTGRVEPRSAPARRDPRRARGVRPGGRWSTTLPGHRVWSRKWPRCGWTRESSPPAPQSPRPELGSARRPVPPALSPAPDPQSVTTPPGGRCDGHVRRRSRTASATRMMGPARGSG